MKVRAVLIGQGSYYLLTGIAPFASRRAFEAITGRKRDRRPCSASTPKAVRCATSRSSYERLVDVPGVRVLRNVGLVDAKTLDFWSRRQLAGR